MILNYKIAKEKLLASDFDGCLSFFKNNGYIVEAAYCELFKDNPEGALELFNSAADYDIRAEWGGILCKLIKGYADKYPTYLQIRNFLEIDIDMMIKNFKGDYVQNIIKYVDWLASFNPEVYKFIGRVFINNGLEEQGRMFLLEAKNFFYHDPELHYLIAVELLKENKTEEVKHVLKTCLEVLPGYYPALKMQCELGID